MSNEELRKIYDEAQEELYRLVEDSVKKFPLQVHVSSNQDLDKVGDGLWKDIEQSVRDVCKKYSIKLIRYERSDKFEIFVRDMLNEAHGFMRGYLQCYINDSK